MLPADIQGQGEKYLIPDGYRGRIFVFYNQKDGSPAEYDNNHWRVYRFNKNGVLKTQFDVSNGAIPLSNVKFYYNKDTSAKGELKCDWSGNKPRDGFGLFFPQDGSTGDIKWSELVLDSASTISKYDFGKVHIREIFDSN